MDKKLQKAIDQWASEYMKKFNRFPTWGELIEAKEKIKKGLDK